MRKINCTVDQLAEALAVLGVVGIDAEGMEDDPNVSAREIASFLDADRIPEPVADPDDWIFE